MILRIGALAVVVWLLGFAAFAGFLPRPAGLQRTDAIVVLTGGPGRVPRGVSLLEQRQARRMLVSGVDRRVTKAALAELQGLPLRLVICCVDLGFEAVDTRSNALETAGWVRRNGYRSIRLVTTDWHMRRSQLELARALGVRVRILPDAVRSQAGLGTLFAEYNKFLLRRAAAMAGL